MRFEEVVTDLFYSFDKALFLEYSKELLSILIILALSFFYYLSLYSKNVELIQNLGGKSIRLKKEITTLLKEDKLSKKQEEDLKRHKEGLKRLHKKFILIQSRLPSEKQLSSILKEITKEETGKNIDFMNVRPFPLEDEEEYLRFPFRVDLEAPFLSIVGYIKRLERLERVVNISNFRIETDENILPKVKVQLHANTFVLNTN